MSVVLAFAALGGLAELRGAEAQGRRAGAKVVDAVKGAKGVKQRTASGSSIVYRGLFVDPKLYDPTRWASMMKVVSSPGGPGYQKVPVPEIWFHARLTGAMSYASGIMTPNLRLAGGKPRRLVLELKISDKQARWESSGSDRGWYLRGDIGNDVEVLQRIGFVKPGRRGTQPSDVRIEWMQPERFFARFQTKPAPRADAPAPP